MSKFAILVTMFIFSGCAALPSIPLPFDSSSGTDGQILTYTSVALSKDNYTLVKTNVVGESSGVSLLGLIPVTSPEYAEAVAQLYAEAGEMEGRSRAFANFVYQKSANFYLLFSIPRIIVRADVVEFKAKESD
ncbi:MAG: DUF6567 family protein [Gammaproteobacteria bacterium]